MFRQLVSSAQCRAARALLQWTQEILASKAGIARKTIADFELENRSLHRRTRVEITRALEAAGIRFLWDDEGPGSEGVILAAPELPDALHSPVLIGVNAP